MSRKVDAFRTQIANPQNIHNFELVIDGLDEYAITVQSTTYPSEMSRVTTLSAAGELVTYPTVPDNSHRWYITIPENDDGIAYKKLEGLRAKYWNQQTGGITANQATPYQDIEVRARDLNGNLDFRVVLKNAWCMGRNDVNLDQSTPETNWKWTYQFAFDYLEDKMKGE